MHRPEGSRRGSSTISDKKICTDRHLPQS